MSLPWILTDEILTSKNSSMMEFVLYPLDLYNDAASRALYSLKQRFLYDEIEAEVNLCFDQLVFKVSEDLYTYYKIAASRYGGSNIPWIANKVLSIGLDKPYRQQLEIVQPTNRFHPPKTRYDVLLRQRHFQVSMMLLYVYVQSSSYNLSYWAGPLIWTSLSRNEWTQSFDKTSISRFTVSRPPTSLPLLNLKCRWIISSMLNCGSKGTY